MPGSLAIENCKGIVHVFADTDGEGRSQGFYDIEPPLPESEDARALVLGIPLAFTEIVQPTVTLDDKRRLYVFGTAWNEVSLTGILLLGRANTRGKLLDEMIGWYEQNRVSERDGPVRLSIGTTGVNAYVVGLRLDQANPRTNTQMFSIRMLTAEIQSGG